MMKMVVTMKSRVLFAFSARSDLISITDRSSGRDAGAFLIMSGNQFVHALRHSKAVSIAPMLGKSRQAAGLALMRLILSNTH